MADPDSDSDPLLGIREIAARLRISHVDARRMCQDGRIPAAKVGGYWFVASSKLPPPGELVGLDVREMAGRLDLSIAMVRAMCVRGEIPAEKVGGVWRLSEERWQALVTAPCAFGSAGSSLVAARRRGNRRPKRAGASMGMSTASEYAVEQPGGHTVLQAGSRVNIHERDPRTGKLLRKRPALVKYTGEGGIRAELVVCPDEPCEV